MLAFPRSSEIVFGRIFAFDAGIYNTRSIMPNCGAVGENLALVTPPIAKWVVASGIALEIQLTSDKLTTPPTHIALSVTIRR